MLVSKIFLRISTKSINQKYFCLQNAWRVSIFVKKNTPLNFIGNTLQISFRRFSKKINLLKYKFCCFKTSKNNNKIDNRIVF